MIFTHIPMNEKCCPHGQESSSILQSAFINVSSFMHVTHMCTITSSTLCRVRVVLHMTRVLDVRSPCGFSHLHYGEVLVQGELSDSVSERVSRWYAPSACGPSVHGSVISDCQKTFMVRRSSGKLENCSFTQLGMHRICMHVATRCDLPLHSPTIAIGKPGAGAVHLRQTSSSTVCIVIRECCCPHRSWQPLHTSAARKQSLNLQLDLTNFMVVGFAGDGEVRLAGGASSEDGLSQYGRLELARAGGWGTVCSRAGFTGSFDAEDALVACKSLGFTEGIAIVPGVCFSPRADSCVRSVHATCLKLLSVYAHDVTLRDYRVALKSHHGVDVTRFCGITTRVACTLLYLLYPRERVLRAYQHR